MMLKNGRPERLTRDVMKRGREGGREGGEREIRSEWRSASLLTLSASFNVR